MPKPLKYPITVSKLVFDLQRVIIKPSYYKAGTFFVIALGDESFSEKTYLGMIIGGTAFKPFEKYRHLDKVLTIKQLGSIPTYYIFDLEEVVFEYECRALEIREKKHLNCITHKPDDIWIPAVMKQIERVNHDESSRSRSTANRY